MAVKKGWIEIPVTKLKKAKWNYKDEDSEEAAELMDALEANFKKNGQVENILVRSVKGGMFEVINGNHRYDVAKRVKLKKLMCFNFGTVSTVAAKRIALETNETKFKADQLKLAKVVGELAKEYDLGELLSTLPYDEKEVENFDKLLNFDWDEHADESTHGDSKDSGSQSDFKAVRFDLPVQVAEQLENQINRFKKILYPDETPKNVSYVLPIEAMIQVLHQTADKNITGA